MVLASCEDAVLVLTLVVVMVWLDATGGNIEIQTSELATMTGHHIKIRHGV